MLPAPITVNIPSVTLKQIGSGEGAQNGAAIKDVVGATMSALAASAANSPQLKDLGALTDALKAQAQQALAKAQKELGQQVQAITGNVTGEINKRLGDTGIDAGKLKDLTGGKDPAKAVDDGLKNLLGGKSKKDAEKK
jgi:citrate lyase gamma subunit